MSRLLAILWALRSLAVVAAEVIPPAPKQYFNDYAGVVSPETATRLNSTLEQFERDTSSQVVVAIFPKMQSESSIEDYTVRVAQSWGVGQKGKDNGAVLFVFVQDRAMYLQVGYGLEGALPDALCKRIIEDVIKPHFRRGDFDSGLTAGVEAIIAAAKGEYKGTGRTVAESPAATARRQTTLLVINIAIVVLVLFLILSVRYVQYRQAILYDGHGRRRWNDWWFGGGFGRGGFSRGGFGGGGFGGGFSGGGGGFGGGGAGGRW